jgi:TPR repeat protein
MRWFDALTRRLSPGAAATVAERMAEAYDASSRGDYAQALEIWGPLAHAGVPRAQNNVGACFAEGLGVGRYPKRALQWLSASAAAGDRLGVDRDPAQAVSWWRRGAERGDPDGQAMLGAAYHLGAGVKRDPIEAFTLLTRARAGGSTLAAGFLDAVRAGLSAQEIAASERRADAPLPEPSS